MSEWTPYTYGLPPCICGEHESHRQRAKYHMRTCPRWVLLMEREGRDGELQQWRDEMTCYGSWSLPKAGGV